MSIIAKAEADLRTLLGIPANYRVLFLQGGAIAQNAAVPLNLLPSGGVADYVDTGHWAQKSIAEARKYGRVNVAASSADADYTYIPPQSAWKLSPDASYVHVTTNETIGGVEYFWVPDTGSVPLVADASSHILSRPLDVAKFGVIYAGAQKNIGPAGLTVVIVRDDLTGHARSECPSVFDYGVQAKADSMFNTPPTFAIYLAGLTFEWLLAQGGLAAIERANVAKAQALYAAIERGRRHARVAVQRDAARRCRRADGLDGRIRAHPWLNLKPATRATTSSMIGCACIATRSTCWIARFSAASTSGQCMRRRSAR
jgi:phosphoserine aminotransferase